MMFYRTKESQDLGILMSSPVRKRKEYNRWKQCKYHFTMKETPLQLLHQYRLFGKETKSLTP